ncbi:SCP2 sterol-binding domain-containing protein [Bacillus sp. FJAT-45350]|uniref:SCP2 sterol-binding domain-containing protein n=1 Tax=Bacillus sp. FJAT-45350 TaxID=2011014 RepID=UPI000BB82356|nr:SCP2 sterol-binding domain-containing protein [Bacillus sp. FJAT-45350]
MSVKEEMITLSEKINANPVYIEGEKARAYQIDLKESGQFQIVLENGKVEVVEGTPNDSEVTLILSDKNFSKLLKGDFNTTMGFMTGNLKVEGKMGLALKLQEIIKHYQ